MNFDYSNTSDLFKKIIFSPFELKVRGTEFGEKASDVLSRETMNGEKREYFLAFVENTQEKHRWKFYYYFNAADKIDRIESFFEFNLSIGADVSKLDAFVEELAHYFTFQYEKPKLKKTKNRKYGEEYSYEWNLPNAVPPYKIVLMVFYDVKPDRQEKTMKLVLQ